MGCVGGGGILVLQMTSGGWRQVWRRGASRGWAGVRDGGPDRVS